MSELDSFTISFDKDSGEGEIRQSAPLNVGLFSQENQKGLAEVLKSVFDKTVNDEFKYKEYDISVDQNKEIKNLNKNIKTIIDKEENNKDSADKILFDAISHQQKTGQIMYRMFTGASKLLAKLSTSVFDQMSKEKEMVNTLTKANVHIDTNGKSFIGKMTELSNKVGVTTTDLAKNLASNSNMINRLNALNHNGLEDYTNALSGWKDVYGMAAEEAPAIMNAIEALSMNMTRAEFSSMDMRQTFVNVATNSKILSQALGISTEELVKINNREEKNLALEGFKKSGNGIDNRLILNLLDSLGFSTDIQSYIVSGKYSSEVASIMAMNPEKGKLINDMRESILRGDNYLEFFRNNANQQQIAQESSLNLQKSMSGSLPGAFMEQNSAQFAAYRDMNRYWNADAYDKTLELYTKLHNGEEISDSQIKLFLSNKEADIAKSVFKNNLDAISTPTDNFVIGLNNATTALANWSSALINSLGLGNLQTITTTGAITSPLLSGGMMMANTIPNIASILNTKPTTTLGKISMFGLKGLGALGGAAGFIDLYKNYEKKDLLSRIIQGAGSGLSIGMLGGLPGMLAGALIGGAYGAKDEIMDTISDWWNGKDKSPIENTMKESSLQSASDKIKNESLKDDAVNKSNEYAQDYMKTDIMIQNDIQAQLKKLISVNEELSSYLKRKQA